MIVQLKIKYPNMDLQSQLITENNVSSVESLLQKHNGFRDWLMIEDEKP